MADDGGEGSIVRSLNEPQLLLQSATREQGDNCLYGKGTDALTYILIPRT